MAVAVAGALAAPVAMAQSNVTISGRMSVGVDSYSAKGATSNSSDLTSRNRVWDNGSRVVIQGNEDLGNGLKAIFYTETGFNGDNGATTANNGQATSQAQGSIGSRLAFVGIEGSFGKLTFGRQHVFWTNGLADQSQTNYVQAGTPFATGGFGSGMGTTVTRQPNTVQYATPKISGFEAIMSWSPDAQEKVQQLNSGTTTTAAAANGRLWGLTAQWTGGPYQVAYDWMQNQGNTQYVSAALGNVQGTTTGHKARAAWSYQPGASLGLIFSRSEIKNGGAAQTTGALTSTALNAVAGSMTTLKQSAWTVSWEHLVGNARLLAQFARAGNITGCEAGATYTPTNGTAGTSACDNTSSKAYMLGMQYLLSKRTSIMVSYNAINNSSNYFADYTSGNNSSYTTAGVTINNMAGADPRMFGVGVQHNF